MKCLIAVVLVFIQTVQSANYYREERGLKQCVANADDECRNNYGVKGTCRASCEISEHVTAGPEMCDDGGCKCCTQITSACSLNYARAYCSSGKCEDGLQSIYDPDICDKHFTCCKEKGHGVTHLSKPHVSGQGIEQGIGTHYITLDGYSFTYPSICTYTVVQQKVERDSEPAFKVMVRHVKATNIDEKMNGYINTVTIENDGDVVTLERRVKSPEQIILLNGVEVTASAFPKGDTDVTWNENQKTILVTLAGRLIAEFNGKGKLGITMHESQEGEIWGILGNFDGNPLNDLAYPSALHADGPDLFIEQTKNTRPSAEDFLKFFEGWVVDCE